MSTPGTAGAEKARAGYTLIELMVVMLLAALLLGMGVNGLNKASSQRATTGARDTYIWLARRGRALAIQQGRPVRVVLYSDSAWARLVAPGQRPELVAFGKEYNTTVSAGGLDSVWISYDPRGFANPQVVPVAVTFTRGGMVARAVVQALGQVEAK